MRSLSRLIAIVRAGPPMQGSVLLKEKFATLSPREREVMQLAAAGKMNKQIAGDLGISLVTVKIHRGAAMRKMGAKTLADLVRMAEALKLPR